MYILLVHVAHPHCNDEMIKISFTLMPLYLLGSYMPAGLSATSRGWKPAILLPHS